MLDSRRPMTPVFNPEDWCCEEDATPVEEEAENDGDEELWTGPEAAASEGHERPQRQLSDSGTGMLWEQRSQHDLPPHVMPAFVDRLVDPAASGLFGVKRNAAMELMDRHAMGNLLTSVSRSRRMGITEEIGLPDPYHETGDSPQSAALELRRKRHVGLLPTRDGGAPSSRLAHAAAAGGAEMDAEAVAHVVRAPPGGLAAAGNGYSSLAGKFPSHISIFGDEETVAGGAGHALSVGADEVAGAEGSADAQQLDSMGLPEDWPMFVFEAKPLATPDAAAVEPGGGLNLPSLASIFGCGDEDTEMLDSPYGAGGRQPRVITQDFAKDASRDPRGGSCEAAAYGIRVNVDATHVDDGGGDALMVPTPKLLEEVPKVPMAEVHIVRKIGEGAFGEVSCANVESHGIVAIKWLKVKGSSTHSQGIGHAFSSKKCISS